MTYLVVRHARACSAVRSPPLVEDVGGRGGRLSPQADLSYEPPSPRDARPAHLGPSPSVHRPTRLTRPLAGAGSQASPPGRRASSERGAGARDILSKPACRRMHGRSETFPAVGMAALPPLTPGGQAGGRSMTCLVSRHARHADLSEPPLVDVCRWDHSSTPEGDGPPVVDVGAEEGGVAEGRVVVGHAGEGGVGEQQGGEMPERVGREA